MQNRRSKLERETHERDKFCFALVGNLLDLVCYYTYINTLLYILCSTAIRTDITIPYYIRQINMTYKMLIILEIKLFINQQKLGSLP